MRKALSRMVLALGLLVVGNVSADELNDRRVVAQDVAVKIRAGDFAGLEAAASTYRRTRERSGSGLWKLTMFYSGVDAYFDAPAGNQAAWTDLERSAKAWIEAYPQSPAAHLAYAHVLVNRAWSIRGGGYAHTVREEDWAPFHAYLEQARLYLEEHKAVAASDPHWYELMARIGNAQGWPKEQFSLHIAEGLAREPLFYQTYFAAVDYYALKWHGTPLAIERFANNALRRTQATEGYGLYARIYWYASQTQFDDRLFTDSVVDWDRMKLGIDDVLKDYPDDWNINNFAYFACLSQDKAKTAELIGRISGAPIASVWKAPATFERCRDWATGVAL